jgi:hypothetical protein
MMYKRHCILALAHIARVPDTRHAYGRRTSGTDTRMGHAKTRAILFAHAPSHLVSQTRGAESFRLICEVRHSSHTYMRAKQLSI